jgi:RecQ family ATP-dependent DNA helicase/uracil-DNA glycosylase family 4
LRFPTEIVCLANSRKHGARCIAGIVPSNGAWVRPVSNLDDGRVERATRLVDGREPSLGDVLAVPLADTGPDFGSDCENRAILPGPWRLVRVASLREIRALVCGGGPVLHNDENCVTAEFLAALPLQKRRTLQLVEARDASVLSAGPSPNGGRKWKVSFSTANGARLSCMLTDPVLMEKLERGYVPCPHALLTVSLSMPYLPPNWQGEGTPRWKIVAAVIELDSPPAACAPAAPVRVAERPRIDDARVAETLSTVFGYRSFRPCQGETVRAILDGRDVFAVMPTGGGKSLCYQLSACLLPGACVVVSPLISLMKDQVDAARQHGIRAACLNSAQSEGERVDVLRQLAAGRLDLIYVSPERFGLDQFLGCLKRAAVCLMAIDEAHCISEWGHDFRPDYLALAELLKQFPGVPIAAFTATATKRVQSDIIARLGLRNPFVPPASFDRPNLFYEVLVKADARAQILSFVERRRGQPGIVYRLSRKNVEQTDDFLRVNGIRSLPYHAGLDDAVRTRNQEAFSRDEVEVVVATIAFGMGIDKPNVRYVVHGDLPENIESYYQQTGRAGRDGDPAHCLLLFSAGDIPRLASFIKKVGDDAERRRRRAALDQMASYARLTTCRRRKLLAYFGQVYPQAKCGGCDNCRRNAPQAGTDERRAQTPEIEVRRQAPVETPRAATTLDAGAEAGSLFDVLRSLRRTIAASRAVPAYIVFSDRTLNEMVQHMPLTEEEMLRITGVGELKLAQFGQAFLAAIRDSVHNRGNPGSALSPPPVPARARLEIPHGGCEAERAPGPQAEAMPPAPPKVGSRVKYTANDKPQTGEVLAEAPGGLRIRSDGGPIHLVPPDAVIELAETAEPRSPPLAAEKPAASREEALAEVAQRVAACQRCPVLAGNRTQTVFGAGNPYAKLVFIGEAPGADEDRQGGPFAGRAGRLLTDIITKGMKLRREDVYLMNVLCCRPPDNRTPLPPEAANCREYLDAQLAIIQPQFLCCLGACAAQNLLRVGTSIGELRGRLFDFNRMRVLCTYHPSYLLGNPPAKRQVWDDIRILMAAMINA